ncbi:hypothetical protein NC653_020867 [Populus alba x Populus x berolinensis]|uniref:Uncharacterized protein n=1 Tax=Populus alba x Populus x berolinensis TaxID=444605 RepID=A0AAD6QD37_9ROSI|nr:hypothetical protein NC653_020867 [Populus alba x Populus x berolinensis]
MFICERLAGLWIFDSNIRYLMLKWFSASCPVCIMLATCNRVIVFKTTLNDVHVLSIYFLFPASSNFSDIVFLGHLGKDDLISGFLSLSLYPFSPVSLFVLSKQFKIL